MIMDIEDVDITYGDGWIVALHRACGETIEHYSLWVSLETIVSDVEGSEHECDSVGSG